MHKKLQDVQINHDGNFYWLNDYINTLFLHEEIDKNYSFERL